MSMIRDLANYNKKLESIEHKINNLEIMIKMMAEAVGVDVSRLEHHKTQYPQKGE